MNRIEFIALFKAMQKLCKAKHYESVEDLIDEVLEEAMNQKKD